MTCEMFPNYFILFYLQMILKLFYSASNIDDVTNVVNNELKQLGLWFRANKLSLNVDKTNLIIFNNKKQHRTDVHIVLNGANIEQATHTTFLGVTIDENLTWREHIKMVETKVSKSIAVLYKTMHVLDCQALHVTYYINHLLNHICHIAVRYGEVRINPDSRNYFCYRQKLYGLFITLITMIIHLYFSTVQKYLNIMI